MDVFYASVEQRDNPALRGKPVIVGAPPTQRGVVCASSYEARKFGVRSAMPSATARRLCPKGIFVRPRMDHYREESRHIMQIVGGMSCIEPQNGKTFTLAELQAYVGGRIQILQPSGTTGAILVINQLGKCLPGLVKNELASRIWQEGCEPGSPRSQDDIVGNVVLCHTTEVP